MTIPPLIPLITISQKNFKRAALLLPCIVLCVYLFPLAHPFLDDDCMEGVDWAAEEQGYELLRAVQDRDDYRAAHWLKQGGNANNIFTLKEGNHSLLMLAAEQGDLPTVKVLLHAGADVLHSEAGETAFSLARKKHHTEVAECLMRAGLRAGACKMSFFPSPPTN